MKRCPQCLFIYPESDERCDFDQTPLVVVADSEIDGAAKPRGKKIKFVFLVVAALIALGVLAIYLGFKNKTEEQSSLILPVAVAQETPAPPSASPSPSPSVSPSPSPSPTAKPSPTRVATSHTTTSVDPVSTSGPGIGTRRGSRPTILLTNGGKIDADEVWRTRDGVWYRKNGIVTLLKSNRVKAIVSQ
jgi:cytoskeletal protein RodZ